MNKIRTLVITALLGAGWVLGIATYLQAADNNIVSKTIQSPDYLANNTWITTPQDAAKSFVDNVNYARVALALKNPELARQHIDSARRMSILVNNGDVEERKITNVESGRLTYQYETTHKYHYFPIQTGQMEIKTVAGNTPVWASPALAVTDAEIVYLTLDLTHNKADKFLDSAETDIANNDYLAADNDLSELTETVVALNTTASIPLDKARDNIALAYNFINGGNFNGALFSLGHADEALAIMQTSNLYAAHNLEITAMRDDFKALEKIISRNDSSIMTEADTKLRKWWSELNDWTMNN